MEGERVTWLGVNSELGVSVDASGAGQQCPSIKGSFVLSVWNDANNQVPDSLPIDAAGCYMRPLILDANSGLKGGIREDEILAYSSVSLK